jgi:hypothetical protein
VLDENEMELLKDLVRLQGATGGTTPPGGGTTPGGGGQ